MRDSDDASQLLTGERKKDRIIGVLRVFDMGGKCRADKERL